MFMTKVKQLLRKAFAMTTACVIAVSSFTLPASAESEILTGKTAMEITGMMGKGWNLGNTLDATGGNKSDILSQEKSWGNPAITKELIDGVKAAGFDTIRIPITWNRFIDKNNNYAISTEFMDHIQEVVDYAYANELFVIINVHHEAWVNDIEIDKKYKEIGTELAAVWSQIADRFADYDQHLIFEGMNEPRAQGASYEWTGNQACYDAVNYLDQVFVTTIRDNGKGYNSERALMIPGYAASNSGTVLNSIVIPEYNGAQAENIIISVHCYSPYNFCLSDAQETFNANNTADTSDITTMMSKLKSLFISNGIAVVIGECGATNSHDNNDARIAWMKYFGEITARYDVPAILWDNGAKGNSGGECHNYFVRSTGEMYSPDLINAFIIGDPLGAEARDIYIDFEPYEEGGSTVLATPEQYGFTPKDLKKLAKINHSPDAPVGFATVIPTGEDNSYAKMDLSKFGGKTVAVTLYLQSKSTDSVTVGVIDSDSKDIITTDIDGDWTCVSFSYTFAEGDGERAIFVQGAGADDFYLDDISVVMIEESAMTEAIATKGDGQAQTASVSEPASGTDTSASAEPVATEQPKSKLPIIIGSASALLAVIAVVIIVLDSKKNKKKDSEK